MDILPLCQYELPKLQTCLSPYVHELIIGKTYSQQRNPYVLDRNGLLDFEYICSKLPADGSENNPVSYFTTCVEILAPMFHSVEDFMSEEGIDLQGKYNPYLDWTGQSDDLLELWEMMKFRNDTDDLTVLLVTTAVLERSLGNVYLLEGQEPCPSMLKDLLVSAHLRNILGSHVVQVLRIVIGPPTSLNIRNVVWHGFPSPGEIPRRCIWFIMVLVPSIGQLLQTKHVTRMQCREPVYFPEVKLISDCKFFINDEWVAIVKNTEFVSWNSEQFWKKVKQFYVNHRPTECYKSMDPDQAAQMSRLLQIHSGGKVIIYSYCTALLLFYLEQGLRRVFATVNKCEDRLLTAEATALYTTFDEILDCRLPDNSENKLCHCISAVIIEILIDHLQYQHGPRVRDRLSHGEACWKTFPWQLTDNLATVAIALSAMFVPDRNKINGKIAKVFRDISVYEVQFHKIAVLKRNILECCMKAAKIDALVTFTPDLSERQSTTEYPVSESHVELIEVMQKSCIALSEKWSNDTFQPNLTDCNLRYSTCIEFSSCMKELLKVKINTLYRDNQFQAANAQCTDRESEVLTILEHITAECHTVLSNLQDFVNLRQTQLVNKQLRSRQRENFKKFLTCFPCYVTVTNMCSYLCCWQLYHLDMLKHQHCYTSKIRFWKRNLQFCENLRTCSQPDKNKWTEGLELITQYTCTLKTNILAQIICEHEGDKT